MARSNNTNQATVAAPVSDTAKTSRSVQASSSGAKKQPQWMSDVHHGVMFTPDAMTAPPATKHPSGILHVDHLCIKASTKFDPVWVDQTLTDRLAKTENKEQVQFRQNR
jgi:hypothetical protein